jgi:hypothetical protein
MPAAYDRARPSPLERRLANSQLDLVINALVLIRKAQSAVDAAVHLPSADRAQLDDQLEAVRTDLGILIGAVAGAVPGAGALAGRREVKMAAGVVEFLARQGAAQLGAVAGVADALRGADSRTLSRRIAEHLAEVGVAGREDLARAVASDPQSPQFQEALERALGSGRAEWYGPGSYGVPRGELEEAAERTTGDDAEEAPADRGGDLDSAITVLESSLAALSSSLGAESPNGSDADDA